MVGEFKLQSMIFRTHDDKTKRWALYVEDWPRYKHFSNSIYANKVCWITLGECSEEFPELDIYNSKSLLRMS